MLILLALLLRLAAVFAEEHDIGYVSDGSDSPWYLAHGYALVTGFDEGILTEYGDTHNPDGVVISLRRLTTPPLFLLFVGVPQALFPREAAVLLIRVFQALAGTISVWLVWRLGRAVAGNERAAFVAALAIAISPAFIFEVTRVTTETLYIALLLAALAHHSHRREHVALTALLLGLATLTRAVLLLFPLPWPCTCFLSMAAARACAGPCVCWRSTASSSAAGRSTAWRAGTALSSPARASRPFFTSARWTRAGAARRRRTGN